MPGPIRDGQIRNVVNELQNNNARVDDQNVQKLLAAVGDGQSGNVSDVLARLQEPGLSRGQQLEIAQQGLDADELKDLENLLDDSQLGFNPGARNFLNALVGRENLWENHGPLILAPDQSQGLRGAAAAGDEIEVLNVSANPEAAESEVIKLKADQWGEFKGDLPGVQQGDHLRVRTRSANGNVGQWISLQASGLGDDTRNAQIYADALGLEADGQGKINPVYIGDGLVSEPGAQLRLTNERNGKTFDVTINEQGQLPADFQLKGKPGDTFSIAVSDGTNNTDFSEVAGTVKVDNPPDYVDLPDPSVWAKKHLDSDGNAIYETERFSGPLFSDGVKATDIRQGKLANCYFCAAVSAVAHTNPEVIEDMMKDNGDGTYTVTFNVETYNNSGRYTQKSVTVDSDLYVRSEGGRPVYAAANKDYNDQEKMELWFPILEKAYAKLNSNSYDKIGNGGNAGKIMRTLMGTTSRYDTLSESNMDSIFEKLKQAQADGRPVSASTYGKDAPEAERYPGSKLYPWHAYTVMGVEEKDGKKFVQLRNPWGNTEPGYDGEDDGVFALELDKFAHFYKGVYITQD